MKETVIARIGDTEIIIEFVLKQGKRPSGRPRPGRGG
jgi:hypothetical protein